MTKLPHYKWERLDELLREMGVGGYYDIVEQLSSTLRHILDAIGAEERKKNEIMDKLKDSNDLQEVVFLLNHFSRDLDETQLVAKLQNRLVDLVIDRKCVICGTRLDTDLERIDWQIPLCKEHRKSQIERRRRDILRAVAKGEPTVENPYHLPDEIPPKKKEGEKDEEKVKDNEV